MPLSVVILSSHSWGLTKDAALIEKAVLDTHADATVKHFYPDQSQMVGPCDILIHLEVPYYAWFPYARYNIVVVNPEWWVSDAYDPYLPKIDLLLFKNEAAMERFSIVCPNIADKVAVVPWCCRGGGGGKVATPVKKEFIFFVGNSPNKAAAARDLIRLWKPLYPPLHIYANRPDIAGASSDNSLMAGNITINTKEQTEHSVRALQRTYFGHICISEAEGFGYTAAEAEDVGAFTILNHNEAYDATYKTQDDSGVFFLPTTQVAQEKTRSSRYPLESESVISTILDAAITTFLEVDRESVGVIRRANAANRREAFMKAMSAVMARAEVALQRPGPSYTIPPPLTFEDCPPISVITLVYNRRKFWELALHNMMTTDYPRNKMEWVIVDDSDDMEQSISDKISKITNFLPGLDVVYVPYHEKITIGGKRNLGTKRSKHDIVLMMDDDDHYPVTSFRRRVAWLMAEPKVMATTCTAIALYDLRTGVSGVNIPPYDIPLGQRMSEATLTFRRSFFNDRKFEKVNIAEGENFLQGRESQVLELMPQQIIVTFCHGKNTSGRRLPPEAVKPACFWGFPVEYLKFIHKLADVEIEI